MGRSIFSLKFELESIGTLERVQLITPLDAVGQTAHARAVAPKERIIVLRVGDWIRHSGNLARALCSATSAAEQKNAAE